MKMMRICEEENHEESLLFLLASLHAGSFNNVENT
jgi:hypothetical protein